uniref:Serpentine receptor class gamma n=1 Tax=Strongyloides stercoralis TaxID=6248 RepID=A0A913IBM8_STRER
MLFYFLTIICSFIILFPTTILFFSIIKLSGYHSNFKYLLACIFLNTILYFLTINCCYIAYLIKKNDIILLYNVEIRYVFTYGGVHFVQIFFIIERILAIILINKYEQFNSTIPYFAIFCHILSYLIYGIQRTIIVIFNIYEESLLIEITVLMLIAFLIYYMVFKNQKNKFLHNKLSFIKVDLSTKYQFIENQKTYYIVTGLLLLFVTFTIITNIIKILFTRFFDNILGSDTLNYIFFMGVFFKTSFTILYLLWKIPSLLKDVKKIFLFYFILFYTKVTSDGSYLEN